MTISAKLLVERALELAPPIQPSEAKAMLAQKNVHFVDVREREELAGGFIAGADHAPRGNLEFYMDKTSPLHKPVFRDGHLLVFVCGSGGRAALAAKLALEFGLNATSLAGGMKAWIALGYPIAR